MPSQLENSQPSTQDVLYPNGFIAWPKELCEKLRTGTMLATDIPVYLMLLHQVDWTTGVWNGNAHRIHYDLGGSLSLSQIRKILARLEKRKAVRSFKKQGSHGNYNILIHGYVVSVGEVRGKVLNAWASTDCDNRAYGERSEKEVRRVSRGSDPRVTRVCEGSDVRPYQDIQDVQDSQERQNNNINNTNNAADDAGACSVTEKLTAKDRFMRALGSEMHGEKTTRTHRNEAWAKAQEVGSDLFLSALKVWMVEYAGTDSFLGENDGQKIFQTWTLKCFLDSMYFAECVERAGQYLKVGVLRDELAYFLEADSVDLTPERVQNIRQCGEDWIGGRIWAITALNSCGRPEEYAAFDRDPSGMARASKAGQSVSAYLAFENDRQRAKALNDACRAQKTQGESFDELLARVENISASGD